MKSLEWWMLDGGVGLIILISAIIGAVKGLGDTILRLLGIGGGLALGFFYGDKATAWLKTTSLSTKVHDGVFEAIRSAGLADPASKADVTALLESDGPSTGNAYESAVPRIIIGSVNGLADKAAEEAADRFTSIIMSVLGFVLLVLAVWLAVTILRFIIKLLRDRSKVLGFADRLAGFVLGAFKGIVIACIAAMLLVPLTTIFAPDAVPGLLKTLEETQVAGIMYDVNPLFLLIEKMLVV